VIQEAPPKWPKPPKTSIPRLRSVKFKSGGSIRLVQFADPKADRAYVEEHFTATLDAHGQDIVGFALVIWGADGSSTVRSRMKPSTGVPPSLVPDLARNRLLGEKIFDWIDEDLDKRFGI